MKKLLLVISLLFTVYLILNILNIVIYDYDRLTEYGFGYLTGKVVVLLLFGILSFFMGKKIYFPQKQ